MTELVQFRGVQNPHRGGANASPSLLLKALSRAVSEEYALNDRQGARGFIRTLEAQMEPVAEFDERLWGAMVDYVTVGVDKRLTVMFRNGTGIHT